MRVVKRAIKEEEAKVYLELLDCNFFNGSKLIEDNVLGSSDYFSKGRYTIFRDKQIAINTALTTYENEIYAWIAGKFDSINTSWGLTTLQGVYSELLDSVPYDESGAGYTTVSYALLERIMLNENNFTNRRKAIMKVFDDLRYKVVDTYTLFANTIFTQTLSNSTLIENNSAVSYSFSSSGANYFLRNTKLNYKSKYDGTQYATQDMLEGSYNTTQTRTGSTVNPTTTLNLSSYVSSQDAKGNKTSIALTGTQYATAGLDTYPRQTDNIITFTADKIPYRSTGASYDNIKELYDKNKWDLTLDYIVGKYGL